MKRKKRTFLKAYSEKYLESDKKMPEQETLSRPFDTLNKAIGNQVLLKLKGEKEMRGTLRAFDVHLNVILENAEELVEGEVKSKNSKAMVRGDSIICIML